MKLRACRDNKKSKVALGNSELTQMDSLRILLKSLNVSDAVQERLIFDDYIELAANFDVLR